MIIPIHKTRHRCEWINCRGISLASFTGIFYTKCLAKNAAKYFNVTGRCPVGFSSWREILGVCQQRLCYFCRPGESIGPVPREKLGERCENTVLTADGYYWPSGHCISAQILCQYRDNHLPCMLDSDKGVCYHHSSQYKN